MRIDWKIISTYQHKPTTYSRDVNHKQVLLINLTYFSASKGHNQEAP